MQLGDDDLALAGAPLARARTFWRLSARFVELSIHRRTGVIKLAANQNNFAEPEISFAVS